MNYLFGLIGHPVSQSMSPPLHKAALSYFGLKGDYKLFDVESSQLPGRLEQLKSDGLLGFNITIPHKIAVYKLCHALTPEAQMVGAANTVLIEPDGRLKGHNTDFMGLHDALAKVIGVRRDVACILGAGGAAKAALRVLEKLGFKTIFIFARDIEKAGSTLDLQKTESGFITKVEKRIVATDELSLLNIQAAFDESANLFRQVNLVVNCLPIGQTISEVPQWLSNLIVNGFPKDIYIYDMVYSKSEKETPLVSLAHSHGFESSDGMSMLLYQALYAFEFWTGKAPPYEILENSFRAAKAK